MSCNNVSYQAGTGCCIAAQVTMGVVFSILANPVQGAMGAVLVANLILYGFGLWWQATALKTFAVIVSGAMIAGFVVTNCLRAGPMFATVFFTVPAACGYLGVQAYRCLAVCGGYPGGEAGYGIDSSDCLPGARCWIEFNAFSYNISLPWWLEFAQGAADFIVSIVNRIPEGICWLNLFVGLALMAYTVFKWNWKNLFISVTTVCGICRGGGDGLYSDDEEARRKPRGPPPSQPAERDSKVRQWNVPGPNNPFTKTRR